VADEPRQGEGRPQREQRLRTPTRELPHAERVRRQQGHIALLTWVLLAVLAVLLYSAAFDLDSAAEWIVLGGIVVTALGALIAVNTR
jgi:membrane protein YdbS with pleckstrin-like domain